MTTQPPSKTRKITLSDRAPVTVVERDWPVIAKATGDSCDSFDYARHQQAVSRGECDRYYLTVRQHEDGRSVVYAVLDAATAWTHSETRREGQVLDAGANVASAIRTVGERCGLPDSVIRDCIAALPAEQL